MVGELKRTKELVESILMNRKGCVLETHYLVSNLSTKSQCWKELVTTRMEKALEHFSLIFGKDNLL